MLGVKTSQWKICQVKLETAIIRIAVHLLRLSTSSDTEDLLGLLPLPLPRLLKVLAGLPGALPSASSNHPWVCQCQCCSIKVKGWSFFFLPDISEDLTSVCPTYAHSLSVDPVQVKAWDNGRKSRAWLRLKKNYLYRHWVTKRRICFVHSFHFHQTVPSSCLLLMNILALWNLNLKSLARFLFMFVQGSTWDIFAVSSSSFPCSFFLRWFGGSSL